MRNLVILLVGLIVGALAMYIMVNRKYLPEINEVIDGEIRIMKQAEIDSLAYMINELREKRHEDSLYTDVILELNQSGIQRITHEIEKVSFREYTDSELDSVISWLYPEPR